ncbi:MAG TPA: hypothetical protein ENL16_03125 [Candidatus Woesearchaeota archaeon]|nr:hypothetical protein [Candidatus Woesearchaeota archaeon]
MNKHIIIWVFLISISILLSNITLAETTEIKNTTIDYTPYQEVVVNEPGVVYNIKITNTGTREKDYEIIPDTQAIQAIGTYRVDPSDKITLKPGEQKTIYFYLAIEKELTSRTIIPVRIRTGLSETTINLVARAIGPFQATQKSTVLNQAFKIILIIIIAIIIILALIFSFSKIRRKKEEQEEGELQTGFDEEIETYY